MNESRFGNRIAFLHDIDVMEVDFSDLTFDNSRMVDEFYDEIERQIRATGRDWFFLVNYRNCRIFELAWIRFAQRGKRLNLAHSRGSVRFATRPELGETIEENAKRENFDPNLFESRDAALAKIEQMRVAARD
jgi:hypothetical protein